MNKYNIQQSMRQQRNFKDKRELSRGLPIIENNATNQTIIINNPNFNINFIDHTLSIPRHETRNNPKSTIELPLYDPKNASKGMDAWSLNKNLKEFSETRQLGFFGGGSKTKSNNDLQNSPYISHKSKQQEIKSHIKIKSTHTIEPTSFREHRTISTINQPTMMLTQRDRSVLSQKDASILTTDSQDESKIAFRRRKFQSKARNPKNQIPDLFYTRKTIKPDESYRIQPVDETDQRITPISLNTRRNRFTEINKQIQKVEQKKTNQNEEDIDVSDLQNSLIMIDSPQKPKQTKQKWQTQKKSRNKNYTKSIDKISKCFLGKVDNYFDSDQVPQIPCLKIQQYTATVQQPNSYTYNIDYKSSNCESLMPTYDFQFEEEKPKNRPRTPYKRKKVYEEIM